MTFPDTTAQAFLLITETFIKNNGIQAMKTSTNQAVPFVILPIISIFATGNR